jgi:uncharacterized membrane protein
MLGVLVGLICAASWAGGSVLLRDLSKKLDPFTLNAPRAIVGGLAIFLLALATGQTQGYRQVTPDKLLLMIASIGLGGGIGDAFYISSIARIGVSRAFPISSTYPAFTLLASLAFLQEEITPALAVGLVVITAGVLLISGPSREAEGGADPIAGRSGVGLALLASLCWAASMTMIAPGIEGLNSIMVASIRTPALALMLSGVVAMRKTLPQLRELTRREWLILIVGGLIGWGLGSLLFVATVALLGPTRAAILTSTSPLFALPMSVIMLKEKLKPVVLAGTALTVAGVILVS